jgi:hypothetical protein
MKDAACVKEHVKGKSKIKTKKCEGVMSEMEKLLTMWMEAQIQKCVPLSLMMIKQREETCLRT